MNPNPNPTHENPLSKHSFFMAGDVTAWNADAERRIAKGEDVFTIRKIQARDGRQIAQIWEGPFHWTVGFHDGHGELKVLYKSAYRLLRTSAEYEMGKRDVLDWGVKWASEDPKHRCFEVRFDVRF